MFFDTHVNLHGESYAEDLDEVMARARSAQVTRFLAICDRLESLDRIQEIAGSESGMWHSVGVHPHYAKDFSDLTSAHLEDLARQTGAVAIGETGMDLHYGYSPEADQKRCFEAHLRAAQTLQLPIIIHTREADEITGDLLEGVHGEKAFPVLMHCYTSGQTLADRALALGAYFSVSGILSFKKAEDVRSVIRTIPLDRIILETDCPYLAPVPKRGQRNEPAFLPYVAEAIAKMHDKSVEDIAHITTENALNLFSAINQSGPA